MKPNSRDIQRRGIKIFVAWLAVFAFLAPSFLSFKRTGRVNILGYEADGQSAIMILVVLTGFSVILLALTIRDFASYSRERQREETGG